MKHLILVFNLIAVGLLSGCTHMRVIEIPDVESGWGLQKEAADQIRDVAVRLGPTPLWRSDHFSDARSGQIVRVTLVDGRTSRGVVVQTDPSGLLLDTHPEVYRVNAAVHGRRTRISFADSRFRARATTVLRDSIVWIDRKSGQRRSALLDAGADIVIRKHLVGAVEGLLMGTVAGAAIGGILGSFPTSADDYLGPAVLIGGVVGGALGATAGLYIGSLVGAPFHYKLTHQAILPKAQVSLIPVGPGGSPGLTGSLQLSRSAPRR